MFIHQMTQEAQAIRQDFLDQGYTPKKSERLLIDLSVFLAREKESLTAKQFNDIYTQAQRELGLI